MDDSRVVDYFVVTGFPEDDPKPLEDYSRDGSAMKATHNEPPITELSVIFPSLGEEPPLGYKMIETTPTGYPANLNHGSLRSPNVFLCYRRGRDKPPLVDIGVFYVGGKERVMSDSAIIEYTPYGRSANVNNGGSQTFITYRRAKETDPCNSLVVTDICVILHNKGETPPHTYCMITKNLNKGMLTSDVYLCYKKSVNVPSSIAYHPGLLGKFPLKDHESFPLPVSVPLFCLPMGATIECWPSAARAPDPVFSTFVLTVSDAVEKVYGAAVSFYERYCEEKLSDEQKVLLGLAHRLEASTKTVNVNKCICILSHWPFFDTFRVYLQELYEMSRSGAHATPIERYISHFAQEVPFPSPQRPRILIEITPLKKIFLSQPVDSPLPLSGASFIELLKSLEPDNCLMILLLALMEQKILVHSLRPDTVTRVTEAISMFIFPFRWQCPYIPLCPLALSDVLNAPMPFIVGFDSRYFDLYDPPSDVYCVDLDTSTISNAEKKWSIKSFPKKPARTLRNSLQRLVEKIKVLENNQGNVNIDLITDDASIDKVFKMKRQKNMLETEIQEAFLRFMATILKGFRSWLLPIMRAPTIGCTDPSSLFDIHGFLKSRDKAYHRFYNNLMKTQMFTRLLEERSFVTDKDASLVFFDECTEKVDNGDSREVRLIECDQHSSERTVVIPLPDTTELAPGETYNYTEFGPLNPLLYHPRHNKHLLSVSSRASPAPNSPMARRTKQEIKSAQKLAQKQSKDPRDWIKCLNSYAFCLWFIHLPAYLKETSNKCKALSYGFEVLRRMEYIGLHPVDEVCYRVLMQLCGQIGEPVLAVKLLSHMKEKGVQPNAITYGYYNKAVLESKWPSQSRQNSVLWRKLRTVIFGVSQFRQSVKLRPPSVYSESDTASTESTGKTEEGEHKGPQSDGGYCSLNLDDTQKSSSSINSSQVPSDCTDSSDKADKNGVTKDGPTVPNRTKNEEEKKYSRLSKLEGADFSEANDFRNRRGSIIKVFPYANMNSVRGTESVNSSAGLLIVGQSLYDDVFVDEHDYMTPKRHNLQWNSESHDETSCSSPSRHNSGNNQRSSLICYSPSNGSECESNSELLRSGSYGSDARILSHLSKESTDNLDNTVFSEVDSSHLKLSDTSLNTYESDDGQAIDSSHPGRRSPNIPIKNSEGRRNSNITSISSPQLTPVTQNDPLGVFSSSPIITVANSMSTNNNNGHKFSVSSQKIKDLSPTQLFRNEPKRRSVNMGRSGNGNLMVSGTGGSKVPRSLTFTSSPPLSASSVSSNGGIAKSSSLPRSNTVGDAAGLTENKVNGIIGGSAISPLWTSLTARIQSTLSPARKSESLFESLKTTMTSKLTEIKEAITTTNFTSIPSTPSKASQLSKQFDLENGEISDIECRESQSSQESDSRSGLGRYSREDSLIEHRNNIEKYRLRSSIHGSETHLDSDSLFTFENSRHFGNVSSKRVNEKTALDIRMTSCSKCHVCQSLLYDEDIMAHWTPEDSNLNTRCPFCNNKVVPVLTVTMMDYRSEVSNHEFLSPSQSVESVRSLQSRKQSVNIEHFNEPVFHLEETPEKVSLQSDTNSPVGSPPSTSNSCANRSSDVISSSDPSSPTYQLQHAEQNDSNSSHAKIVAAPLANSTCVNSFQSENSVGSNNAWKGRIFAMKNSLPSSVSSSLVDICDDLGRKESLLVPVATLDPITLPYLSPIVLRKELESVLEDEGDGCLTRTEFVDRHPIIYWNLVWYCRRLNLPSNLPGLCLKSKAVNKDRAIPRNWLKATSRNVIVRCMWDCPKLHEEHGLPMYLAWHQDVDQSSLVHALITETGLVNKGTMQQIISGIECDDIASPLKILIGELRKRSNARGRHFSVYRDLLFLCVSIIGRENVDLLAFDREYRWAFRQLTPSQRHVLQRCDYPPSDAAILCRQRFGSLEL